MVNLLSGIQSTSSALNAERVRMEVVSQNIANANVSVWTDGRPYQRQRVVFEKVLEAQAGLPGQAPEALQVARIEPDARPARTVYRPGEGWVKVPNINIHEEMVDLIASSRAFEANLAVVKTSRNLALQALAIGKRA